LKKELLNVYNDKRVKGKLIEMVVVGLWKWTVEINNDRRVWLYMMKLKGLKFEDCLIVVLNEIGRDCYL
jgi:hypothetical protein